MYFALTATSRIFILFLLSVTECYALSETVSAHAEAIDKNRTDIGLISELKTIGGGGYDDSGNGILDVLHHEFHALINYNNGLIAYIESLEERIRALEDKE